MTWLSSVHLLNDGNACWTYNVPCMAKLMTFYLMMTILYVCICQINPAFILTPCRLSKLEKIIFFTVKYKYLGTLMTHDGSDDATLSRQRFFYARSNGLSKNFNAYSPSVKTTLFRTFCREYRPPTGWPPIGFTQRLTATISSCGISSHFWKRWDCILYTASESVLVISTPFFWV